MAYGAYRLALEKGIRIPDACRIVGIDDNALNAWIAPWLISVRIPYADFGAKVVGQLQALWAGEQPSEQLLPHRLMRPLAARFDGDTPAVLDDNTGHSTFSTRRSKDNGGRPARR